MKLIPFTTGPFQVNSYLLEKEEKALLIDPGFYKESEFEPCKKILKNVELQGIVLTHAHIDHVLGLSRLLSFRKVPVYMCDEDYFLWDHFGMQCNMYGFSGIDFGFRPLILPKSGLYTVGDFEFECLFTPGHSPEHLSFYFKEQECVISGDALFRHSIGRTDLYKGSFELLSQSIKSKLYTLPGNTTVYPGHGDPTSIEYERLTNPFVKA